jgi:hypothetical protein
LVSVSFTGLWPERCGVSVLLKLADAGRIRSLVPIRPMARVAVVQKPGRVLVSIPTREFGSLNCVAPNRATFVRLKRTLPMSPSRGDAPNTASELKMRKSASNSCRTSAPGESSVPKRDARRHWFKGASVVLYGDDIGAPVVADLGIVERNAAFFLRVVDLAGDVEEVRFLAQYLQSV